MGGNEAYQPKKWDVTADDVVRLEQPYRGQQKVGVGLPVILNFEKDKFD